MNEFKTLEISRTGAVATITLTRPDLFNRFDDPLHVDFTDALTRLRQDANVRAIVLASMGKVFSAGGDFELMRACHADVQTALRVVDDGRRLLAALLDTPQPIVAALQGDAIGLGATVVLACDAVVASRTARILDPHVAIGLVAGDGGCLVWPQAAGMLRAKRHLLTGDPLGAEDAFAMGLVTDLVDSAEEAEPAALALAERIAALPPLAVQGTKKALNRVMQHRASEVVDLAFAHETVTLRSEDLLEAIAAFKERRPGHYRGV